jgi:hypothetical protein
LTLFRAIDAWRLRPLSAAFHDGDEIGPVMVGKVAKKTGLTRGDL